MGEDEDTLSRSTPLSGFSGLQSRSTTKLNLGRELQDEHEFIPDFTRPIRGGYIEHLQAAYVGGAPIDHRTYLLQSQDGTPSFRGHGQLRSATTMGKHLASIRDRTTSTHWLQFHGSVEATPNSKQLGKVDFLQSLNSDIKVYGLEALFSPQALDGRAKLITENLHEFTLQCVTMDHSYRSRQANKCTRGYDIFETSDFSLSHELVKSYLSSKLYSDMQTAYTDIAEFAYLPGQVLLMLSLEQTNNLVTYDIDEARKSFEALKLISYPGENIGDLVKDSLKYLRIMDGGYSLPYNVQSTFLYKVNATNSTNFNFQVAGMLQQVLKMEDSVGQHKSPLEIKKHAHYASHNVWKLCEMVSATYRQEVGHNRWVVESLPVAEGNLGSTSSPAGAKNPKGHFCWDCGSFYHFCNSADCPLHGTAEQGQHQFKSSRPGGGGIGDKSSSSGGEGDKSSKDVKSKDRKALAPWRLLHPADDNATCTVDGREYKFCAKCVYRETGQKGFFTTGPKMHSTAEHRSSTPPTSDSSSGSEGNLGEVRTNANGSEALPATEALLDSSDPGGMYAGAFTAAALGFHSEVLPVSSSADDEFFDAVSENSADAEALLNEGFTGWDLSGSAFLAAHGDAGRPPKFPAAIGAYVRIINPVCLSMGKVNNAYGKITATPKPGGMYYKISVFDRGLQCFKEMRRCRDKFAVVGVGTELPPLLTAWKPDEESGSLLTVGLGNDLSVGVRFEYLFSSRECPISTESQYSLLSQVRQHLVTSPPEINRDDVPDGYLDDDTAVSSFLDVESDVQATTLAEEITDKVNSLAL